jgi:hypothetical protein
VALLAAAIVVVKVGFSVPLDDFWMMIAGGRHLLAHGHLGSPVPLTFTPMVRHSVNGEWGAEALFALCHWTGLALALNVAAVLGGLAVTASRIRPRVSPNARIFALAFALATPTPFFVPRAQSFSVLLFPCCLLLLERWRDRSWTPAAYAMTMAVWANLHGAFILGQLAVVAFLVGDVMERRRNGALVAPRRARRTACVLLAAVLAPLLNPAGLRLLGYAYTQGNNRAVRLFAHEWHHAFPWDPMAAPFFVLLAAFVWFRVRRRSAPFPGLCSRWHRSSPRTWTAC